MLLVLTVYLRFSTFTYINKHQKLVLLFSCRRLNDFFGEMTKISASTVQFYALFVYIFLFLSALSAFFLRIELAIIYSCIFLPMICTISPFYLLLFIFFLMKAFKHFTVR